MRARRPLVAFVLLSASASAQPRPAPRPAPPPAPPTLPDLPPPPDVADPMLAPMPQPRRAVATWDDVMQLVRARSTDLRIAYLEVERAAGQWRIALAGALPSLNGTAVLTHQLLTKETSVPVGYQFDPATNTATPTYGPGPRVPTVSSANASLALVQPLFAPRAWYGIGTARESERVAALSVVDVKRTIVQNVANAVIAVITAERIAELNRVGLRNALERHDLSQRKQLLGAATGLDVIRARQDVESARATLVTGDEQLRQAREALGLTLGIPEQIGVSPAIRLEALERDALGACRVAPSIDERADIAAARSRLVVAHRGVNDVKLQFSPTINAQSTLATTTLDVTPATTWNIQAVLSVPFFEGGARYGALRSARAVEDETEQQLVALRRGALVQVEQARRAVVVADTAREVAAAARNLAAETDRLVRTGYREGQGTSLELVIAAAALREAEINLALKEFDVVRARVAALLALATCPF